MCCRFFFSFFCLVALSGYAQKRVVIYDLETKVPIRQVRVRVDRARTFTTPYTGQLTLPAKFDTLIVSHPKYLSYTVAFKDVGDSIGLIPRTHTLGEVEVVAEDLSKRLRDNVNLWGITDPVENQLVNPKRSVADFDFFNMFDFKGKARKKRTRKVKKALGDLDEKDPIKRAYEQSVKGKEEEDNQLGETKK